ncbi:hypothetical protein E2C01_033570 [Portunus trituberculatus]|uniref:Uncharacterized protein n=1 Tax=Portunus trituberculatus TaxID=210409 RepID=A0A5B7F2S7_PORTR|nr:hypothetical protein [Portunus trituberculatus]
MFYSQQPVQLFGPLVKTFIRLYTWRGTVLSPPCRDATPARSSLHPSTSTRPPGTRHNTLHQSQRPSLFLSFLPSIHISQFSSQVKSWLPEITKGEDLSVCPSSPLFSCPLTPHLGQ